MQQQTNDKKSRSLLGSLAVLILLMFTLPLIALYVNSNTSEERGTSSSTASNATIISSSSSLNKVTQLDYLSAVVTQPPTVPQEKETNPRPEYKRVFTVLLNSSRTISLLGEVGANALQAADQLSSMARDSNDPIYLILSGPGGSILSGNVLISAIQASKAPVYTICVMFCASMDAMIHQYGKKRYMTDRTIIMFHPASAGTDGDIERMYTMSKFLKRYTNKMEYEIAARWGVSYEEYKAKSQTNNWLDSEDAVKENVADAIVSMVSDKKFDPRSLNGEDNKYKKMLHNKEETDNNKTTNDNLLDFNWICGKDCGFNVEDMKWNKVISY